MAGPGLARLRRHPNYDKIRTMVLTGQYESLRDVQQERGSMSVRGDEEFVPELPMKPVPQKTSAPKVAKTPKVKKVKAKEAEVPQPTGEEPVTLEQTFDRVHTPVKADPPKEPEAPKETEVQTQVNGTGKRTKFTGKTKVDAKAEKKAKANGKVEKKAKAKVGAPSKVDGGSKIKLLVKENPRRGEREAVFAKLMKFDGKTVEEYLSKGGERGILRSSVKRGQISLV